MSGRWRLSRVRSSTRVFMASSVLAIVAAASLLYQQKQRRDFSVNTTTTMGTVLSKGSLFGLRQRSRARSEYFCWVSYTFTPADATPRRNWRLWEPGCGTSRGRPIPIQYATGNPDINRPGGDESFFPWWLFFFAAGVAVVIGVVVRGSEQNDRADSEA